MNSDRPNISPLGQVLHPGVHGPTEVVVVSRDGNIVKVHGHGVQSLGSFDKIITDSRGTMDRFQRIIQESIGRIDLFGILSCGLL